MPWYAILGNHDYYGNESAQILYTYQPSASRDTRWTMPDNNYTVYTYIDSSSSLEIFVIDAVLAAPYANGYNHISNKNIRRLLPYYRYIVFFFKE